MKKSILFASFICAALSASAQLVTEKPALTFEWGNQVQNVTTNVKKAPLKADLKDGEFIVGYFTDDKYDNENGLGFNGDLTLEIGTEIPAEFYEGFKNLKVDGVRFGMCNTADIEGVTLYGVTPDGYITEPLATKTVNSTCVAGWNYVEFDEPVAIDESYLAIIPTYKFVNKKGAYAMGMNSSTSDGSFLAFGPLGQNGAEGWFDMGLEYGTPAIQVVCYADPVEGYNVKLTKYESTTVGMGQDFNVKLTFSSTSDKAIENIHYTLTFGDEVKEGTQTFSKAIPAGIGQKSTVTWTLTAPNKAGAIPFVLTIDAVNGEQLESPITSSFSQNVVTRIAPRMSVVEEYTGTGCGWCPRGWLGMEKVKNELPNEAAVIAIHQFNNTDPMYVTTYHTPAFTGAPQCVVDRKGEAEPYYGDDNKGIVATVKRYASVIPEVAINVEATWSDETQTKVDASATTEFLTDLEGSELIFVLTADGLTGTTSAWKQGNYYANYTAAEVGVSKTADPELYEFCKGGSKGQSSLALVFNDVLIGSSWTSSTTANKVAPFSTTTAGETASSAYTIALPTKTTLKSALIKDQIYVTAFVLKADGTIANAARCKVVDPTGINSVLAPVADNAMYDLSGRVNNSGNGIFIQNGKKVIR